MISNSRDHLRLLRARVEGDGRAMRSIQDEHDILGFEVSAEGWVRPLTILGWPNPLDGWTYAIFNERAKTWTTLDGTVYAAFKDFLSPLYAEAEKAAGRSGLAAGAPGPQRPPQHRSGVEPTPDPPGGVRPSYARELIGGGEPAPLPWKSSERS